MSKTSNHNSAESWLKAAVRRIVAKARPSKIILFGSRVYGKPDAESDFDLLVLLDSPDSREGRYDLVDMAIGLHRWPVDILVRTPKEVEERLLMGDSFLRTILRRGKILYES